MLLGHRLGPDQPRSGRLGESVWQLEFTQFTQKAQSIAERLTEVGVPVLKKYTKSNRICKVCLNMLIRVERDLPLYRRWVQEESTTRTEATH